jgi:hypothetical protein
LNPGAEAPANLEKFWQAHHERLALVVLPIGVRALQT